MKKGFLYATKIWLLAVLTAPLLLGAYFILLDSFQGNQGNMRLDDFFGGYILMIVFGGAVSVPVWLLFGVLIRAINDLDYSLLWKKIFIQIISVVLCVIVFVVFAYLIDDIERLEVLPLSLPYLIMLSVGIWVFHLKENEKRELRIEEHLVE